MVFLKFWYLEAPWALVKFFLSLNQTFLHFFSLGLFLKTFFKPWKNEYREGLVGFSIGMGMFIKTIAIIADIVLLLILILLEIGLISFWLLWPVIAITWTLS
ncbi:hypothetical protein HYT17_02815 [Candidatus Microgenomates bacterium]|nr:hypothetical protein [Candidatus Microgenomates bacterium]